MPKSDVFCADCLPAMREYPDGYFDLAVVDPPYGIGVASSGFAGGKGWKKRDGKDWDASVPKKEYFVELFRVSQNQIIWGGNYFTNNLYPSMGWIFWDKGQRDFSLADGELAWTSFNKALRCFDYSRGALAGKRSGWHPTEKPVALYRWIYQHYAKPGDKILDTHMGSQSSRIAAYDAGLDYTGYEIDETYFKLGCERFERHTAQMNLFVDFAGDNGNTALGGDGGGV